MLRKAGVARVDEPKGKGKRTLAGSGMSRVAGVKATVQREGWDVRVSRRQVYFQLMLERHP